MYLSRLILNPRSHRTQQELAAPYEMHRTIMSAFPENLANSERVLFRVDVDRHTGIPTVLVQSQQPADWSALQAADGYLLASDSLGKPNPAQKQFELSVAAGQRLAFRLRANPSFKRDGRRLAWLREEDQRAWLDRKAEAGGFRVLSLLVIPEGMVTSEKHSVEASHRMSVYSVRFDGLLMVTDSEKFRDTLAAGIGPAKAFGFGLLSVAPVH